MGCSCTLPVSKRAQFDLLSPKRRSQKEQADNAPDGVLGI